MVDLTLNGQYQEATRLVRSGQLEDAAAVCRRILTTVPKHIATYSVLGQVSLGMGEHEVAANIFRRVLSADPEHALAYASLGAIYEERSLLDEAIWQLQRAFELSPGNVAIREELSRLCAERSMSGSARVKLTRGGLARTYFRGRLYPKAIGELRELLEKESYRHDLRAAFAHVLWLDGRLDDAEAVCLRLLAELPECLKALLILGRILLNTQKDDQARELLQHAQQLDPDNVLAQALFGAHSPLPPRVTRLPFTDEDAPPLELAYLAEGLTEGTDADAEYGGDLDLLEERMPLDDAPRTLAGPVSGFGEEPVLGTAEAIVATHIDAASLDKADPPPGGDRKSVHAVGPETDALRSPLKRGGPSPDATEPLVDPTSQLGLAQRYRDGGQIWRAIAQYRYLLEHHPETASEIARDLELVNRLYPNNQDLASLLSDARQESERFRADKEPSP